MHYRNYTNHPVVRTIDALCIRLRLTRPEVRLHYCGAFLFFQDGEQVLIRHAKYFKHSGNRQTSSLASRRLGQLRFEAWTRPISAFGRAWRHRGRFWDVMGKHTLSRCRLNKGGASRLVGRLIINRRVHGRCLFKSLAAMEIVRANNQTRGG